MWWDQWRNMNNTDFYLPFPFIINKVDNAKEGSDSYHVYVNGDYVGDKTAIIQGEEGSKAIKDYLQSRGFNNLK